jgi:hypothetical protein
MHNLVSTLHTLFDVLEMLYFESLFRVRSMPFMERPREGWSPLTFEALSGAGALLRSSYSRDSFWA